MTEIKVGPQKKKKEENVEGNVVVELISAMRYVFRGKIYQYGYKYTVSAALGDDLLDDENDKGMPYFRAVVGEKAKGAISPREKPLKKIAKKKATRRSKRRRHDPDDSGAEQAGDGDDGIEVA